MRDYRPIGATHIPVLIKAVHMSTGPILELGSGPFSTALLHSLAIDMDRELITYENGRSYYERYSNMQGGNHKVFFVDDWDKLDISYKHWGVALVDHSPDTRRRIEIKKLANCADYIVAHDSDEKNDEKYHKYSEIYPLFKYHYDYKKQVPNTVVLSNKYKYEN